jgi:putative membrane-bound dehydrogenase-like protein
VAAPPVVEYPMTANFDERGRLFVAHAAGRNVRDPAVLLKELPNSIRLLDPADERGRFTRFTVFADKMTFPTGALWYDGTFYCCSGPYLWKMHDTKGAGVADRREELVGKFEWDGHAGDIKGPFLGPDGRLYWTDGLMGHRVVCRDGSVLSGRAARIWRCKPNGDDIEAICGGGMDNPVMMTFTAEGEPLSTSTLLSTYPARYDGLIYCIDGGVYPHHAHLIAEFKRTGDVLPPVANLGHVSPSGVTRYRGTAFGAEYRDNLFVTYYNTHKVQRLILERKGATFRVRAEDFLVSDSEHFHPTYVLEDADGSLLVVDTGGWITVACYVSLLKPEAKGGIYRIRKKDAPPVADPRGLALPWETLATGELTKLLDDPRFVVRDRAILALARRGAEALTALKETVQNSRSVQARRNAVWALTRMETPEALALVRTALDDKDMSVRLAATHSVGLHRDAKALERLCAMVITDAPSVRREAATALGRIKDKAAVSALLQGLKTSTDRFLDHALIHALIQIADVDATSKAVRDTDPSVRRGALIALDQMDGSNLTLEMVTPLLDGVQPALREEALRALIARPHWAKQLRDVFRQWLLKDDLAGQRTEDLRRLLLAYCRDTVIQDLIALALRRRELPAATRLLLLETMAQAPLDKLPATWVAELRWSLEDSNPCVVRQSVANIRAAGVADCDEVLLRLAADTGRPTDFRVEALAAATPRLNQLDDAQFELLRQCLDREQPPLLRLAAASALGQVGSGSGKAHFRQEQWIALTKLVSHADSLELPRLLGAYERIQNPDIARQLIAALDKAPALESLTPDALRRVLQGYPAEIQQAAEPLFKRLDADAEKMKARLTELGPVLTGGDSARGRLVFFGKKALCATCHTVGTEGGKIGPDLSKIATVRTGKDLLESVVFPSASFVRGYEPYVVATKNGKSQSGILKHQTTDAIFLVNADRAEIRIPRKEIEAIEPGKVSIMPQGLDAQLSRQELTDLLAFLQTLR